jgi:hypothetical protein
MHTMTDATNNEQSGELNQRLPEASPALPANAGPAGSAASGRDARGRFAKGNCGGPGNPFAGRAASLRWALLATVTVEDLCAVAQALVAKARKGDRASAELYLAYVLGQPPKAARADTPGLQYWEI